MTRRIEICVDPEYIDDPEHIRQKILKQVTGGFDSYRIVRRSVDARRSRPRFRLQVELDPDRTAPEFRFSPVPSRPEAIVVGAGPAGYCAALELIALGIKPVVLERGPAVEIRRKSIARLLRHGEVDADANYCFGEGGAGAFSDGKLYTRSHKRGDIGRLLHLLILHGASPDILVDAHPHIGSDKLPALIRNIRRTIIDCGGEVHFNAAVSDVLTSNGAASGVCLQDGSALYADAVILAVGHSAEYTGTADRRSRARRD